VTEADKQLAMQQSGPSAEGPPKRAYARPQIESSALFERRSLVCGTQPNASAKTGCGVYHQSV
jgi:hypothetical protein